MIEIFKAITEFVKSDFKDLSVSNELSCEAVDTLNAFKCESTWIEVKDDLGASVILGVCDKCPAVSEQELKEIFNAISQASNGRCLIVGDLNYPNINWDNWECNTKDDEEFVAARQRFTSACRHIY